MKAVHIRGRRTDPVVNAHCKKEGSPVGHKEPKAAHTAVDHMAAGVVARFERDQYIVLEKQTTHLVMLGRLSLPFAQPLSMSRHLNVLSN